MKTRGVLFVLALASLIRAQSDSIIISEIMFYPQSGNNEFIELYNLSTTQSVDVSGCSIRYYTSLPDTIVSAGSGTIIPPQSYAVIVEGDYDLENGIYRNIIPLSALLLKISSNAFGSNGMANTASRPVLLNGSDGLVIDSVFYSANNSQAISDEKKILSTDTSSLHWSNSLLANGTPGFRNSVMLYDHDLKISGISFLPVNPVAGDDIEILAVVKNSGTIAAESFITEVYLDMNHDSIPSPSELIFSELKGYLGPGDTTFSFCTIMGLAAGNYGFIVAANYPDDEFPADNITFLTLQIIPGLQPNSVIINEIMYAPLYGQPEWIEIYNSSDETINLKNWGIGDAVSAYYITQADYYLAPKSFLAITKDSSITGYYPFNFSFLEVYIPSLNNTGDAVKLLEPSGKISDSLYYYPNWGGSLNRSLERIDPASPSVIKENWTSSENRYNATPGFINSVTPKNIDLAVTSFSTEEQYGISGSPVNFVIKIENRGKSIVEGFYLSLYQDADQDSVIIQSEEINLFTNGEILPGGNKIFRFSYSGFAAGDNYFISKIHFTDEDSCNNVSYYKLKGVSPDFGRGAIVINEIMYAPENEPEWLEIVNNSSKTINLKNFRIADKSDTVYLTRNEFMLDPESYLVISGDSILLQLRKIPSGFIRSSVPAFNNTGDKVMLIDSLQRIIDSLEYIPSWGGMNGYSLERINLNQSLTDSLNWGSSVNRYKGSPGYINSLSTKTYDAEVKEIIINPLYPVKGDTVDISVSIKNPGSGDAEIFFYLYRDTDDDSLPDVLLTSSVIQIPGRDSLVYQPGYSIRDISSEENLFAMVIMDNDQDTTNNYAVKNIRFGYKKGSIVINEVLYNPQNGESEWIELYNRSADIINMHNWSIRDVYSTPSTGYIQKDFYLLPGKYVVISADTTLKNFHRVIASDIVISGIPNLNNDADGVVLIDDRSIVIDSMLYTGPADKNRSYERISVEASSLLNNWGYSADFELSTPGRINSLAVKNYDLAVLWLSIEPEYPCLSDTLVISACAENFGTKNCSRYNVSFLYGEIDSPVTDSVIAQITVDNLQAGETAIINCPVKIILERPVKIAVRLHCTGDADTVNSYMERKIYPGEQERCIVINEIMYDPEEGSCEWIEIYNSSMQSRNLKNWSISDILPSLNKNLLTSDDIIIEPGEFMVIAPDSSVKDVYQDIATLLTAKFGSLSSTTDGIILYDYRDGIIDSVHYSSAWGGRHGRSLERKSADRESVDPANWATSLSPSKATPGKINSVSGLPSPEKHSVVINEVMYEPGADNCEFIEFYNKSGGNINIGGWRIEDSNTNYFILSDTSYLLNNDSYFVLAADSSIFTKYGLPENSPVSALGKSTFGLGSSETIVLRDLNGSMIDSLSYSPAFHNKSYVITRDRSLEKINPFLDSNEKMNWSTCTAFRGATPAGENSVNTSIPEASSGAVISPNPFSPDNDGWEDFAVISYNFRIEAPQLRIRIFDSVGSLVRTLADNTPSGSKGQIIFDGRDENGRALRIGIYILFIEASGRNGTETHKSAFVIARKL